MRGGLLSAPMVVLLGLSVVSHEAHADELSDLQEMMKTMRQQMDTMQKRIVTLETEKTVRKKPKKDLSEKQSDNEISVSLKPTPKFTSKDGSFEAKVIGFAQADAVFQNDDTVDHPDSTTIKRARLGLAGKIYHDWGYKFLYDFGNNNNDQLQDMFITYNGVKNTQFKIGQYKEPIGLEWQSASKYWTFMELPLTTAITPRRSIGAGVSHQLGDIRINLGAFGENTNKTRTDDEGYSFDGHLAYTPIHDKGKKHLHIGASGSYRVPDGGDAVAYSAKHETSSSSTNSLTTGSISNVDAIALAGVEALGIYGPFILQSEYMSAHVSRESGFSDATFNSYYVQAAWMLTGESRNFNPKKHAFARVVPKQRFSPKDGGWGAWELATRFENLDLTDGTVTGGQMDRYTLGLNWYANGYIRMTTNYSFIETDANANIPNDESQVLGVRAHVDF